MISTEGGSSRTSKVPFLSVLSIFLAANLIASSLNHIDDTDETYGYYEPLHYLLYGVGMQTWEYSPLYAIRTYTFITPFWGMCSVLKFFLFSKLSIFFGIRIFLGTTAALSETYFVSAVYENYGRTIGNFTFVFTLFSSGILYCSTALLPSAVIMSIVMIASASWLRHQYSLTVFLGCISVLWSGWPFAGVIFVPFGLHMLVDTYSSSSDTETEVSTYDALKRVTILAVRGATILGLVAGSSFAVDFFMYSKRYKLLLATSQSSNFPSSS
jgi:alpha-1,2-mannosyltransferase